MAEPTPRRNEPRLRPAPLLFEPTQVADDPEHFFDLESIDDPRRFEREIVRDCTEMPR